MRRNHAAPGALCHWHRCVKAPERVFTLDAHLLAPVLGCLLVWLGLLSSVHGILLVELEHLHLLLDGIHGCLLLFGCTNNNNKKNVRSKPGERREGAGASVPYWTLSWSAGSASLCPVKYVLSSGGWLDSFGHPILFWRRRAWVPGRSVRICSAIRCSQTFDFWYAFIWGAMDKQAAPKEGLPNGNVTKAI